MNHNLFSLFLVAIEQYSKKDAIQLINKTAYTFNDLDTISAQVANALYSMGIRPGDRVASKIEKSAYNLFLYLGCLRSGIIYLPFNTGYAIEELKYFFEDAKPSLVICDPLHLEETQNLSMQYNPFSVLTLDKEGNGTLRTLCDKQSDVFNTVQSKPSDIAVILYTSGTTGKPKGAMITHEGLASNAKALNEAWGMTDKDTILHALPLYHVHGLFFAVHTALLVGASIILLSKFEPQPVVDCFKKATVFMGVPTHYIRLINANNVNKKTCANIRLFISGSAPLLDSTFNSFYEMTGQTILERYGMTETGINTSNPLVEERKVGSVGKPLSGVLVRVVDEMDNIAKPYDIGHIQVKGKSLFQGYWQMPEKTAQDFTEDGFFKTGDMGYFDDEGYLFIVGRQKDLVISGGLNVYPREIELSIDLIDGVIESAVIGIPHPDLGEVVVAVIVAHQNLAEKGEAFILEHLKSKHAKFKLPKKVFFINELPKNTMGKVQKNVLRNKHAGFFMEAK